MRRPRVLVVIVSYRSASLTVAALRSLIVERAAGTIDVSALVVDNASGDTPEIARAIADDGLSSWVRLITAERNGGFAYGNNIAFREAFRDGGPPDFFHLLNPDTAIRPGALRELVTFLEAHPEAGIAGSGLENQDGSSWPIAFRFPSIWSEIDSGLQLGFVSSLLREHVVSRRMQGIAEPVDWVPGASMMVRRRVIENIGGMDEAFFLYFEETEFCRQAKSAGWACWYVPESRVMHIAGQSTKLTERRAPPKRYPTYWFESRRRYLIGCFGVRRAVLIDLAAIAAQTLGFVKRQVRGDDAEAIPHFLRDFIDNSVVWPRNRRFEAPIRAVVAPSESTP